MRKLPTPRFVLPASVEVGDTIRVTRIEADTEVSVVGTVHKITGSTLWTAQGLHLLTWSPGDGVKEAGRVTLLGRAEREQVALFGAELLEEAHNRV